MSEQTDAEWLDWLQSDETYLAMDAIPAAFDRLIALARGGLAVEAACAEMRTALQNWPPIFMPDGHTGKVVFELPNAVAHALSSEAGKGWLSPEQVAEKDRRIAELEADLAESEERCSRYSHTLDEHHCRGTSG